ncbi:hypothetical protein MA16_Dca000839 [Dendrobium catenatum]|uniref:Reverse transcriptase domain-containing protein n=1 Tax=Dendrobium catenatum TaxID=906689 RepID=A0A2I0WV36_9ASPA|nr:hypothetical protein MA16_Dca000839 [Dendrobium catenatum]
MPLYIFKRLDIVHVQPTTITLQLADRSFTFPKGVVKDVLMKVDMLIFSFDFIIVDMEKDREIPLILGRSFLATRNVHNEELIMKV